MPADRVQKSRSFEKIPDLGDPDRKRMMNVLAQRRYRQRRREKIAALEAQAKCHEGLVDDRSSSSDDTAPQAGSSSVNVTPVQDVFNLSCEDIAPDFAVQQSDFNTNILGDLGGFPILPTPLPSSPEFVGFQDSSGSPCHAFPLTADGSLLVMPVMSMIQAFMSIANALNLCNENLWNPSYMHVMSASTSYPDSLPANLRPVPAQLVIPHHPALDILPWPTMREKLILLLALPSKMRPLIVQEEDDDGTQTLGTWPISEQLSGSKGAGQSKAITQLVQDLDDFQDGGGIRVHGNSVAWGESNELIEEVWEVGESFYRKWWFCLDQRIIDQSNKRRKERGLGRLRLTES
ncbi:hypothetical protein E8E13_003809 [Curvularia kusanoi]|uniref:BZIP domain-containing protein n=1 Tax=Curvularia kusanoi TaxID=90978 RepID=A0A9P4WA20_CURKU|nr:hypothetical protein E8E13_003809 [Curvularia kusanoi]